MKMFEEGFIKAFNEELKNVTFIEGVDKSIHPRQLSDKLFKLPNNGPTLWDNLEQEEKDGKLCGKDVAKQLLDRMGINTEFKNKKILFDNIPRDKIELDTSDYSLIESNSELGAIKSNGGLDVYIRKYYNNPFHPNMDIYINIKYQI